MDSDRLPKQLLFGWLPQIRPAHGPRLRWKDRIADDLRKVQVVDWYQVAHEQGEWRSVAHTLLQTPTTSGVSCSLCCRSFKSAAGLARHKCINVRQLPIEGQPGAKQYLVCQRWFKSAEGLVVHKCQSTTPSASSASGSASNVAAPPGRLPVSTKECCSFHCNTCGRCFKSNSGFHRHNCDRGKQRKTDRDTFQHACSKCSHKFRRPSDLKRHKCRLS